MVLDSPASQNRRVQSGNSDAHSVTHIPFDRRQSEQIDFGVVHRHRRNTAVLIQTKRDTWKAKRIKRGSPVGSGLAQPTARLFIGKAEISSDSAVRDKILDDFRKKYWENRVMGVGPSRARFESGERAAIKITPFRDLQDGFKSAPGTPPPRRRTIAP